MPAALPTAYSGSCASPTTLVPGGTGEDGADGSDGADGVSAYTTVATEFQVPAVDGNVEAALVNAAWVQVGQLLFIQFGGYFEVLAKDGNTVTIENPGYDENSVAGTAIPVGSGVSPGGPRGVAGDAASVMVLSGVGPPEGAVIGSPGWLYTDTSTGALYNKVTGTATNTGWQHLIGP